MNHVVAAVALLAVVSAGGTVWLLVRDERGRSRASSARALRRLTAVSALVVLVTVAFLRPWYWDLAIAAGVAVAFGVVYVMLGTLQHRSSPASWGAIAVAMGSVVLGAGLVTLGGTAAVIDGAALVGGKPVPVAHDGQVLGHPVLYQVFWGPVWDHGGATPALAQAAAFERGLPTSQWASVVVKAGFGVGSLSSGGCWIDPDTPTTSAPAASTSTGPFPAELRRVFSGRVRVEPCPGFTATEVPKTLPPDAVVALWLDPGVAYELGGVSVHSSVPWPGRPDGLATAAFTGGFAFWGGPSCARSAACRSVPGFASPTYALSHEFVEATTNPFGHGWYADVPLRYAARYVLSHGPSSLLSTAPAFEGEVADLCEPGQPDAPAHEPVATLGPSHVPVADFYRPGTGCVS
ncbi:MAG: hypothetical protein ABSC30_07410 [Acidimicrobiales bacterium]|jgi:hypothetical protein